MKRILLIEHAPLRAEGFLQAHKETPDICDLDVWRCYEHDQPPFDNPDGLIVGGGPMMVEDLEAGKYPFFTAEKDLIGRMIAQNRPTLGICLGSQILCARLGGSVGPKQWVVGWHTIIPTNESHADPLFSGIDEPIRSFQYHRDHFLELPPGSTVLGTSPNSTFEAFRLGDEKKVWGCVFHPEMDVNIIMNIFDVKPEVFTNHDLSRPDLAPFNDGRRARRMILRNFFKVVANEQ